MVDGRLGVRGLMFAVLAVVATTGWWAGDVRAADGAGGGAADGTIWSGVQTGSPPTTGGADGKGCRWKVVEGMVDGEQRPLEREIGGITHVLYVRTCDERTSTHWIPRVSARTLARQASSLVAARLPEPSLSMAPSPDANVVGVAAWFWIPASSWKPVTATAWVPTPTGVLWARTTATPIRILHGTADSPRPDGWRSFTSCTGPGEPWRIEFGDRSVSDCSYEYRHSSAAWPGGAFPVEVSVVWSVEWTSNASGGGDLPDQVTTVSTSVVVDELQALVR